MHATLISERFRCASSRKAHLVRSTLTYSPVLVSYSTRKPISRNAACEAFTVNVADVDERNGFGIIGHVVSACRRF